MDINFPKKEKIVSDVELTSIPFIKTTNGTKEKVFYLVIVKHQDEYFITDRSIANIAAYTLPNIWYHLRENANILENCFPIKEPGPVDGKRSRKTWCIPYSSVSTLLDRFSASNRVQKASPKKDSDVQQHRNLALSYLKDHVAFAVEQFEELGRPWEPYTLPINLDKLESALIPLEEKKDIPSVEEKIVFVLPVQEIIEDKITITELLPIEPPELIPDFEEPTEVNEMIPVILPEKGCNPLTTMEKLKERVSFDQLVVKQFEELSCLTEATRVSDLRTRELLAEVTTNFSKVLSDLSEKILKIDTAYKETIQTLQLAHVYDTFVPTLIPCRQIGEDNKMIDYAFSAAEVSKQFGLYSKENLPHPDIVKYLLLLNRTIASGAEDSENGKPYVFKRRIINRWNSNTSITGFKYKEGYELFLSQQGMLLIKTLLREMITTSGMLEYEYNPTLNKAKFITLNFRKYATFKRHKYPEKFDNCHMHPEECKKLLASVKSSYEQNLKLSLTPNPTID